MWRRERGSVQDRVGVRWTRGVLAAAPAGLNAWIYGMQSNADGGRCSPRALMTLMGTEKAQGANPGTGTGQPGALPAAGWGSSVRDRPFPALWEHLPGPSRSIPRRCPCAARGTVPALPSPGGQDTQLPHGQVGFDPRWKGAAPRGTKSRLFRGARSGAGGIPREGAEGGGSGGRGRQSPPRETRATGGRGREERSCPPLGGGDFVYGKKGCFLIRHSGSSADPAQRRGPRGPFTVLGRDDVFVPLQSCCLFSAAGKCCFPPLPSPAPSRFKTSATF